MRALQVTQMLIRGERSTNTCALCFTQCDDLVAISERFEIQDESDTYKISIAEAMKETLIIDMSDFIFDQTCQECTTAILRIYILLRKYNVYMKSIYHFVDNLSEQVEEKLSTALKNNVKEFQTYLKLNAFTFKNNDSAKEEAIDYKETLQQNDLKDKQYTCELCKANFHCASQLKTHKTVHRRSHKATVCHVCGKLCKTPSLLKAHLNCHNSKKCPYCFKQLKTHGHYKIHVKRHETGGPRLKKYVSTYKCDICSYKTTNKLTLEAHINKIHLDIRPYVCEICAKGFYKKSHLVDHGSVHFKLNNITCEICGLSLVNKKCLREHLRLHSGEKPYKCDLCQSEFISSGRRSDHIKRKHSVKSEVCQICNKTFSLKKELNRHTKNVHNML